MSILCLAKGHRPLRAELWNEGYYFSCCDRCGCDLIRTGMSWGPVPGGHRVVWKAGAHRHSLDIANRRGLPIAYAERRTFDHRWLLDYWRGTPAVVDAKPERQHAEAEYPYLLALAAIAGAGMQLLLRYRGDRIRYARVVSA